MTAPSLRALGTVVSTTTTTPSFAAPAGAVSTDVILVGFFLDDGRTTVTVVPSNFTLATGAPQINDPAAGSPSHGLYVYWGRFADVGAGPYGFTVSGSVFVEGRTAAIQACITTGNPFEATNGATSGNTNVTTAPSVSATSLDVDRYAFYVATNWAGGAWTPATGFTEQWDANNEICTFDDKALPTAQTVTPQAVCAGSSRSNAWVGILLPVASAAVPPPPARTVPGRDPGEVWWVQRDRRDANTVGSAANVLPSPLDTASRYPHLYGDWTRPAAWPQQRPVYEQSPFVAVATTIPAPVTRTVVARDPGETWWQQRPGRDPAMLGLPQLENELLGGADTAKRYVEPATHAPRWWMPQQPPRVATAPGLLDTALLESPLLGAADDLRRHAVQPDYCDRRLVPQQRSYVSDPNLLTAAELENELLGGATTALRYLLPATHADRREMPQQRPYISDPSFYPTVAPTDPLTVAWGAGGPLWWLYNAAAAQVDRREVPQQRRYVSDPALLLSALLENELLGSADDLRRRTFAAANWLRPTPPAIRTPSTLGAPDADPLTLTGDTMRRVTVAAYADRREVPAQPPRRTLYFDAGPDVPPLTLAFGAGGAYWHLYNRPSRPRPFWPVPAPFPVSGVCDCMTHRPYAGMTSRPSSGTTGRPSAGITLRPCTCQGG